MPARVGIDMLLRACMRGCIRVCVTFGFILSSLCGKLSMHWAPMRVLMAVVFPAPDGPRDMIPQRTNPVSYSWIT